MAVEGVRTYRWFSLRVVETVPDGLETCESGFSFQRSDTKFVKSLTDDYLPCLEGAWGSVDFLCTSIAMLLDEVV
jgi:hypothetical protein